MEALFRKLTANDVEARVQSADENSFVLLIYKNARVDQNILDEKVGAMNWQRHHLRDNANCIVSIWDDAKKQWIEKEDTGTESFTEAEKGLASDSFKRACFNWGIGRELYTAPNMFVFAKDLKTLKEEEWQGKKKWTCKDYFTVAEIEHIDKKIVYVKVLNQKTGNYIEFGTPADAKKKQDETAKQTIDEVKVKALIARCENEGVKVETILKLYKVKSLSDLNEIKYANINANWEKVKASQK
jgi:hypothetical protein